jgi:hypothetical protein
MNLDATFPLKYCINLSRREDRRFRMDLEFYIRGLDVQRVRAINKKFVRKLRHYPTAGRYANAISHRVAIRKAKICGADAVLIFEDDVVFAADFAKRVEQIELPDDWGIWYLGCRHWKRPTPVAPGLVRVSWGMDTHAYAVKAEWYNAVLKAMRSPMNVESYKAEVSDWGVDFPLAELHATIPTYACWPNLAWQYGGDSDLINTEWQGAYSKTGRQRDRLEIIDGVDWEMAKLCADRARDFVGTEHLGIGGPNDASTGIESRGMTGLAGKEGIPAAKYIGGKQGGWYTDDLDNWRRILKCSHRVQALQIGGRDGVSTSMMLDELFVHPCSAMHVIAGVWKNAKTQEVTSEGLEEFLDNIALGNHSQRVVLHKGEAETVIGKWLGEGQREVFDFIYIEGAHNAAKVWRDAALSWPLLKVDGILAFDDYLWTEGIGMYGAPRIAVDAFEVVCGAEVAILLANYRRMYRKLQSTL